MARTSKTGEASNIVSEAIAIEENDIAVSPQSDLKAVLSDINEAVGDITGGMASHEVVKSKKVTFELTDLIPCKSLFLGRLVYVSPTNGARYVWNEFGAVTSIPFGELQTMNNHKPQYLNKPLLLVTDANVAEFFNLISVYEKVANINKINKLLNSGDIALIRKKIQGAIEVGMKDILISKIRKMREENVLVDINIINALKDELKYDIG